MFCFPLFITNMAHFVVAIKTIDKCNKISYTLSQILSGKSCDIDYDGCASSPCLGKKALCIDKKPHEQTSLGLTYSCNCTQGYKLYKDKCVGK